MPMAMLESKQRGKLIDTNIQGILDKNLVQICTPWDGAFFRGHEFCSWCLLTMVWES